MRNLACPMALKPLISLFRLPISEPGRIIVPGDRVPQFRQVSHIPQWNSRQGRGSSHLRSRRMDEKDRPRCIILFCATSFASDKPEKPEVKADGVLVLKKERVLQLLKDGKPFKDLQDCLGRQTGGAKAMQGDNKTPEGKYVIDSRNPQSIYHLSLHVSYPMRQDSVKAKASHVSPGATS